jgi:hypothetical protein
MEAKNQNWKDLCAQIAVEQDSQKLTKLLEEMLRLLDAERQSKQVDRGNDTGNEAT